MSEPVTNIAEAPSRRVPPRRFIDGGFTMIGEVMMMKYAQAQTTLPPVMRLWLICQARVNRYGHCAFLPGELKNLLGDVHGQRARYALRQLKAEGMAAAESTTLCIVLDCRAVRRDDNAHPRCHEPGHLGKTDLMWMDGQGWEPKAGQWQEILNNPERLAGVRRKLSGDVNELPLGVDQLPPGVDLNNAALIQSTRSGL